MDLESLDINICDQLRSSQHTLDFMYCFSEALDFRVVEHGKVLIRTKSILLSLPTKKSGCSEFKNHNSGDLLAH